MVEEDGPSRVPPIRRSQRPYRFKLSEAERKTVAACPESKCYAKIGNGWGTEVFRSTS